jgi:hypothetical protein
MQCKNCGDSLPDPPRSKVSIFDFSGLARVFESENAFLIIFVICIFAVAPFALTSDVFKNESEFNAIKEALTDDVKVEVTLTEDDKVRWVVKELNEKR